MSTPEGVQRVLSEEDQQKAREERQALLQSDEYLLAPSYDEFQHGLTRNIIVEQALEQGLDPHEVALQRPHLEDNAAA